MPPAVATIPNVANVLHEIHRTSTNNFMQEGISPEIYFPAVAVAACIILFGFILIYILRAGATVRNTGRNSSPARFSEFFDKSDVGIGVIDEEGFFVLSNHSLQNLTGYTGTQLSTIGFRSLFADRDDYVEPSKVAGMLDRFGESHQVFLRRRDGSLVRVRFLVLPAPEKIRANAEVLLVEAAMSNDGTYGDEITEDASLQEAKDSFFASLNNDLKTPLTVMLGNASLLAAEREFSAELVNEIITSGKRLLNELDGLLLLANLRAENESNLWLDAHSIISTVTGNYTREFETAGITISYKSVASLPVKINQIVFQRIVSLVFDFVLRSNGPGVVEVQTTEKDLTIKIEVRGSFANTATKTGLTIAEDLSKRLGGSVRLDANRETPKICIVLPVVASGSEEMMSPVVKAA